MHQRIGIRSDAALRVGDIAHRQRAGSGMHDHDLPEL
jgi:hypothetical protein